MKLQFKFIPLTFQKDETEIKKQIRNTIILKHFFDKNESIVKLDTIIEGTQYGYNASALESGKNKFLRISDITDGKVDWKSVPYCDCSDEDTYLLHNDDILVARTGGTTGKSFIITNPPEHSVYAGYLIRIRANKDNDTNFINLFLNSYVYWSQIVSLNEGEFRPSANAYKIKNLLLPKCTISQQKDAVKLSNSVSVKGYEHLIKKIDVALTEYDNCKLLEIENGIQTQLLSKLRQSILQEAIQGKLTAEWREQNPNTESASELLKRIKAEKEKLIKEKKIKKEKPLPPISEKEIPFELPNGWVWCRFLDLVTYQKGKKPNLLQAKSDNDFCVPYIDIAAFERNYISNYTNDKKAVFCGPENILLVWDGARMGLVGKGIKGAVGSTLVKIDLFECNVDYIFKLLQSYYSFFNKNPKQAGLPHMNGDLLDNLIIALPPLSEQQAIVTKVEILLGKCSRLQMEIENLNRYSKDLLQALFSETFENKKGKRLT